MQKKFPGFWMTFIILTGIQLVMTTFPFFFKYVAGRQIDFNSNWDITILILLQALVFGSVGVFIILYNQQNLWSLFSFKYNSLKLYISAVFIVIGLNILLSEADNLFRMFYPMPPEVAKVFFELLLNRDHLWFHILVICLTVPLCEELLFRGGLLLSYLGRYNSGIAILMSAFFFAYLHTPWQFLSAFIFGIILAWVFTETRCLWPSLFMHGLNNSMGFITRNLLRIKVPGYTELGGGEVLLQPLWFDLFGVFFTILGLVLLLDVFKRKLSLTV